MNLNLPIVVAVLAVSIFLIYSCQFSFAKTYNEKEEEDRKYSREIFNLSINKNETRNGNFKESYIQNNSNNILTDSYPDHYYVCGYPKQLITDYSFLEKLDCY